MKRLLSMGLLTCTLLMSGCQVYDNALDDVSTEIGNVADGKEHDVGDKTESPTDVPSVSDLPLGLDYVELNNNKPTFTNDELELTEPFMAFEPLDEYGRVGVADALLDEELMPPEQHERGGLSHVTPTGWYQNARGDEVSEMVDGGWLYNRSHLIGHQLGGDETDVAENLMTGTRAFNLNMLEFENAVAAVVEQGTQVRYRVTPVFDNGNLLSHGVIMEGFSLDEDGELGDELSFNIFIPNEQDGIVFDYRDGTWGLEQ